MRSGADMARKPKKIPQRRTKEPRRTRANVPDGYDSWFEFDLKEVLKKCQYHGNEIAYVIEKRYKPDFTYFEDRMITYIESKGRFRSRDEAAKYVAVRNALSPFERLVFIFAKPSLAMPGARPRRNGTKQSHAEWADSNGFVWYSAETIPKEWQR
jgi:hypothetical protein